MNMCNKQQQQQQQRKRLKRAYRIRSRSTRLTFVVDTQTSHTCTVTMNVGPKVTLADIWDILEQRVRDLVHASWSLVSIDDWCGGGDMTQTWRIALGLSRRTHTYAMPPMTLHARAAYDATRIDFIDAYEGKIK